MMRGSTAVVLPVVCLLLGLGAGYLLFGDGGAAPVGADDAELTSDGLGDPDTRPSSPGSGMARLEGSGSSDPFVAALRTVPAAEPVVGEGVIKGTVTDKGGAPVPGVHMTLTAVDDSRFYQPPDPTDDPDAVLLKQMRQMVERHRWGSAFRQVTMTDASGAYRFDAVTSRKHRITAMRAGYRIHPRDHSQWGGVMPGVAADYLATAMARLRLEIVGGTDAKTLKVELRSSPGGRTTLQWSAVKPVIDCQPGAYNVYVTGGDMEELRAGPIPVVLKAGAEPQTIQVTLESRPVLRLHLKYTQDEVMPLQVYTMPMPAGGMPTSAVLLARGTTNRHFYRSSGSMQASAEEDVHTITDVEAGTYVIGVARRHRGPIVHMEEVVLRPGIVDHVMQIPPLDADDYVIVGAYGPDGEILKDARFSTGYRSDSGSSSGGSETAMRRDGRVVVLHQQGSDGADASGTWWVRVKHQELGHKTVEYVRGQQRELRVDFQKPGSVTVAIEGAKGTPYEGRVSVALRPEDAQWHGGGRNTNADKDGRVTVGGLQPGEYFISLFVSSGRNRSSSSVAEVPFTVKSGAQETSVSLPPLYALTVRGGSGHVSLSAKRTRGERPMMRSHKSAQADKDGVVLFDALLPGTYNVYSGRKRADVTIPGTSEVTLKEQEKQR